MNVILDVAGRKKQAGPLGLASYIWWEHVMC